MVLIFSQRFQPSGSFSAPPPANRLYRLRHLLRQGSKPGSSLMCVQAIKRAQLKKNNVKRKIPPQLNLNRGTPASASGFTVTKTSLRQISVYWQGM